MACVFLIGLARNPIYLVQKIGAAVVGRVLLDTFLIRPVLVPALALVFGSAGRWLRPDLVAPSPRTDRGHERCRPSARGGAKPILTTRHGLDARAAGVSLVARNRWGFCQDRWVSSLGRGVGEVGRRATVRVGWCGPH